MNKKILAFCGYRCDLCPAYMENLDKLVDRTTLRNGWKTFFGFDVPEERILCVGCQGTGNHLDTECLVRPCVIEKNIDNCSLCNLFDSCEKLTSRADILNEPKKRFEGKISKKEYKLFFHPYEGRNELQKQKKKNKKS